MSINSNNRACQVPRGLTYGAKIIIPGFWQDFLDTAWLRLSVKGLAVPAKCSHHAKKLAEAVSAFWSQLIGVFNWCLLGARHGHLLTPAVLPTGDVACAVETGKGLAFPEPRSWK